MKEEKLPEKISLGLAVISLFLTIYFAKNELFQLIFVTGLIITTLTYFILKNSLQIRTTNQELNKITEKINTLEKSLSVFDRLNKLEKEVFKK